jgi:hypothetical protein
MDDNSEWSARRVYNDHMRDMTVDEAAKVLPLSTVARSMQRHRVRNRPELPNSRRDLVLQAQYAVTSAGQAFVLIDDGMDDKIVVFATMEQLHRFVFL